MIANNEIQLAEKVRSIKFFEWIFSWKKKKSEMSLEF